MNRDPTGRKLLSYAIVTGVGIGFFLLLLLFVRLGLFYMTVHYALF